VKEAVETPSKRKSEAGEGDGPVVDSTDAVAPKKAKVDAEEKTDDKAPAPVEASA